MRIDKKQLTRIVKGIVKSHPESLLDPEQFARALAEQIERRPSCIQFHKPSPNQRFSYATVGYGIYSLMGEKYRMGRIEVFDEQTNSDYQIHEGSYCFPHEIAPDFENFIESLHTHLPIQINLGTLTWCKEECAKALGLSSVADLSNKDIIKKRIEGQKKSRHAKNSKIVVPSKP